LILPAPRQLLLLLLPAASPALERHPLSQPAIIAVAFDFTGSSYSRRPFLLHLENNIHFKLA
jgi:hypothetical protein